MPDSYRLAILGAQGLLGRALAGLLVQIEPRWQVAALGKSQADVTQPAALSAALANLAPDAVINCAGFLNVDRCEREPEGSYAVNAEGPINVAAAIAAMKGPRQPLLIQLSTDFVFDGSRGDYDEQAVARPLSYYGTHKLIADEYLRHSPLERYYVLRIASLICCVDGKDSFIKRMIALGRQKPHLDIVDDLVISMVTAEALAAYVAAFLRHQPEAGIYNAVCGGTTSWYRILRRAFDRLGVDHEIRPARIDSMPNGHIRPRKSNLLTSKLARLAGVEVYDWEKALDDHLALHRDRYAPTTPAQ